jgi:hypothetical protein
MRKGINPVKQLQTVEKPQRVTAAVLNHIPFLDGFYADMLKVLDLSLTSLRENAGMDFDLLVYDNGSCAEARDYLLTEFDKGVIQTLILSDRNMVKAARGTSCYRLPRVRSSPMLIMTCCIMRVGCANR